MASSLPWAGFKLRGSLRRHLLVLVLAAIMPLLAGMMALGGWYAHHERKAIERGLMEAAGVLSVAVDQSIASAISALRAISLSEPFTRSDFRNFHRQLVALQAQNPAWFSIWVADAEGRQIINTLRPFGSPLPPLADPEYGPAAQTFREAAGTGAPAVSDLFIGPITGRYLVAVGVPKLDGGGRVTHVLMMAILPEALGGLLTEKKPPPGWLTAILDRSGRVVARTPDHQRFVGDMAVAWLMAAMDGTEGGVARGKALDGNQVTVAFQRSGLTRWTVIFGAPRTAFLASVYPSIAAIALLSLTVLASSILLAVGLARRIAIPVKSLSKAAEAFVPPGPPAGQRYRITELDTLYRALDGMTERLVASETRFRQLFACAPVMLDVVDADFRLVEVNDHWLAALGYDREEVLGRPPWDFQTAESRALMRSRLRPLLERVGMVEDEPVQFLTKTGELREILLSARAEYDVDGRLRRTVSALRDVTAQLRTERALSRAIEEAEEATLSKTRFLAAASHDLRQPLQALALYFEVLKQRLAGRERPVVDNIGQCVSSLSSLLNDMLDVARLDAGAVTPNITQLELAPLLARLEASFRIQAEAKGLSLRILPCGATVRTDEALLERLLSNLLSNAVRYTVSGRILVGCRRASAGTAVRIQVWDTGLGIPADKLDAIFEEFRQLANPERRSEKGTGLGLAIVQRISRLLDHPVEVRSRPGRGSVFSVLVPLARAAAHAGGPVSAEGSPPLGRDILVIDDEPQVRAALAMMLDAMGHRVTPAESADEALSLLGDHRPDVVISDYRLTGGATGIDAIGRLRNRFGPQLPAMILTGDTDPSAIRRIMDAGLPLVHKPLRVEQLQDFLKQVA